MDRAPVSRHWLRRNKLQLNGQGGAGSSPAAASIPKTCGAKERWGLLKVEHRVGYPVAPNSRATDPSSMPAERVGDERRLRRVRNGPARAVGGGDSPPPRSGSAGEVERRSASIGFLVVARAGRSG